MKKFVFGLELGIKSKVARVAGRSKYCSAHFRSKGWAAVSAAGARVQIKEVRSKWQLRATSGARCLCLQLNQVITALEPEPGLQHQGGRGVRAALR